MPEYRVRVILNTIIEAGNPDVARRIALEGAVALIKQDDSAEADFNDVMPQVSFPRFTYETEEIAPEDLPTADGDTPNNSDELDKQEEIV